MNLLHLEELLSSLQCLEDCGTENEGLSGEKHLGEVNFEARVFGTCLVDNYSGEHAEQHSHNHQKNESRH